MAAGGLLTAVFLLFIYGVLVLRIQAGGGYAPYSSFRTDPLGTRALHDALAQIPGIQAARHQDQYTRLKGGDGDTLFILGLEEWVLERDDAQALEIFMSQGGRVVTAFHGHTKMPYIMEKAEKDKKDGKDKKKTDEKAKPEKSPEAKSIPGEEHRDSPVFPPGIPTADKPGEKRADGRDPDKDHPWQSLEERWGFQFAYTGESLESLNADVAGERPEFPIHVPWRSALWFKDAKPGWRPVYSVGDHPVVLERDFGRGQLILLSDSYLFSNEALRRDRQSAFLLGMAGKDRHRIIFDEAHLGSIKQEGVMTLARRYRLTGFLLAGLAVVGLYLWRNVTSLAPRRPDERDGEGSQAGLGAGAALTSLLRRSVAPASLPQTCWREWLRSFRGRLSLNDPLTGTVEQLLAQRPAGRRGAAETVQQYRAVAAVLAERKVHRGTRP